MIFDTLIYFQINNYRILGVDRLDVVQKLFNLKFLALTNKCLILKDVVFQLELLFPKRVHKNLRIQAYPIYADDQN